MFSAFGTEYLYAAIFKAVNDILAYVQPQLLRLLLIFVGSWYSQHPEPKVRGVLVIVGMFLTATIQTVCMNQYLSRINETGMRVRAGLTSVIYRKSIKLSHTGRAAHPTGSIINHIAVDAQRLQMVAQFGHQLWSAPLQLILCLLSLYQVLGLSMMAGVAVMILTIPFNSLVIRYNISPLSWMF
jgi:ATP-binding cassette, subfamily C (CFTR/MRP), member 1